MKRPIALSTVLVQRTMRFSGEKTGARGPTETGRERSMAKTRSVLAKMGAGKLGLVEQDVPELKAGAVAAVFSTPEQIAEHAEDVVAEWLRSGNLPSGTQFPRYYHIGLNGPVAKRLGIAAPSESDLQHRVHDLLGDSP